VIKENESHYIFEGVLHLNADEATMKLTRKETKASAGTRQCAICISVPKSYFDIPPISINVEMQGGDAETLFIHKEVENALSPLPVVVNLEKPSDR